MLYGDKDFAPIEVRIARQLHRVHHRAGGNALFPHPPHDLDLVVLLGPLRKHFVDHMAVLEPLLRAVETRITDQLLASHHLYDAFPMRLVGARRIDVAIVVWPAALAGIGLTRRIGAHDALIAHARSSMAPQILGSIGDSAVIDNAVLHRASDQLALAGELALIERAKDADRSVQPGAGVADRRTRLDR